MDYQEFLEEKSIVFEGSGFEYEQINNQLFPFQRDICEWTAKKGRSAIFADCGMGKTAMQLEWASNVSKLGKVLIVAPLSVSMQTIREGQKFGVEVFQSRDGIAENPITITNYEILDKFDCSEFVGIVIDESSILKSVNGRTRNDIINSFADTQYRLACTATPSPNDFTELGNHAEFLGIMTQNEMLAKFFFHDGGEIQSWFLKGHAEDEFWKWVCSWAVMIRKPSDIGHDDSGFILPKLNTIQHVVEVDHSLAPMGQLFKFEARTLEEQRNARRETIKSRCELAAKIVNESDEPFLIWCDLNSESDLLEKLIHGAKQVSGSDSIDQKEQKLSEFTNGSLRVLVTKAKIAGFGMNWQHCKNVLFVGVTHSYESFYQAVRRCYRFGQKNTVDCHVISADIEGAVANSLLRKEADAKKMQDEMIKHMSLFKNIKKTERMRDEYKEQDEKGNGWVAMLGDTVERIKEIPDNSIGFSIFSPPFASLYTFSNSARDLGNCDNGNQFMDHFRFIVKELNRITMEGRLVSFHCMNLPTSKTRDGYIGLKDFRGELIQLFISEGWIFHSEVVIWKDPVTAMQRTKALGLLHKTIVKDSSMSRQGIPDYLVTMRKSGKNGIPISGILNDYVGINPPNPESVEKWNRNEMRESIDIWQRYASPVWMDINPSRTLQKESAREEKDERHICPLQLDVIERALQLWSMPNDTVFSPFMGIGSEGHCSVKMGRKFIGCELKESYFKQAVQNLKNACSYANQDLFAGIE
jgi:superfamily II DNA or RNA helicase